ncbi:NADP-dependent malic enzyme [Bhargavaea cecembensis DSE10]|uniref:NADP-dependent malic enzyme n=1 Tax=Bhargavaea cecembensis DSE10 TaxID=1235279 RepID=M7NDF3_9BACL|nr:malic enzyme-like NAD(P)-binding protein [Bhargavaea cecembensis]EMR06608.1 NADP-dependent malic enzyme [Bhargavaea cecembensis DSE10]
MSQYQEAIDLHEQWQGKLSVTVKPEINNMNDLSLAYSPGVAGPCIEIAARKEDVYRYTSKGNLVAVISNGTAVLGLGNIGPEASLPVMEGKSALFKRFADINSVPLILDAANPEVFIQTVKAIAPSFGGINLEDIAAPECFYIEESLKQALDIPVFHDDQHGTAIVVVAALINAGRLVNRNISEMRVVINGAGSAGIAIVKLLNEFGVRNVIMCDTAGAIYEGRPERMNSVKEEVARFTNPELAKGDLIDVLKGADVFIGVSSGGALTSEMVAGMNEDPIVFAMANPVPEIMPEEAKAAGVRIIGTGRSDYPNQINNVLAFPGVFRGALLARASKINEEMKKAAATAIAGLISDKELRPDYIIPNPFDERVVKQVAKRVSEAAYQSGAAKKNRSNEEKMILR